MTKTWALGLILAARLTAAAAPQAPDSFSKLAEDYWETQMRLSPLTATFVNHPRYHDTLDDYSAAGRETSRKDLSALLQRLKALRPDQLAEPERTSAEIMRWQVEMSLERDRHKFWQFDVDHMDGPQGWIPSVIELAQPMATPTDVEHLLTRLQGVGKLFSDHTANLREGLKAKRVAARVPVEKAIKQLEEMVGAPAGQSPYVGACKRLSSILRARHTPRVVAAVESHVYPAYREYLRFLKEDYLPRSRTGNIGLSGISGGVDAYRYQIKYHTTLDKTAAGLHATGLEELAHIRRELEVVARRMGHEGDMKSFLEKVRTEPANFFKTREEVLKSAQDLVAQTYAKLPEFFGVLPKTQLVVKPIEEYKEKNDTAARYYQPPDDLSRPGIYYINTYEPHTRARYGMASLAAHEGVPGHHMQIAIALEQRGLPAFRRNAGFTAYVEGWALYAERLADEMGLYPDDLSRVGMLSDQAWRAARLVIDTGLHAKAWTRQQAIAFMKENTAASEEECVTEIDRYTIWPGQALAYKVGQMELLALRRDLDKALEGRLSLKDYHDAVLLPGSVPLPLLRRMVTAKLAPKAAVTR